MRFPITPRELAHVYDLNERAIRRIARKRLPHQKYARWFFSKHDVVAILIALTPKDQIVDLR